MSKPGELVREAPPASEAPEIIYLPPPANDPIPDNPAPTRKNGRAVSTKPGSQISRRRTVKDPRSARLDIRCTPAIRAKAEAAAQAAGISVAGYVEALIDGAPGPRVHRNPSEEIKLWAQTRGEMSKRGGNLNQAVRSIHEIRRLASDGEYRDRLIDLLEEAMDLLRPAVAENRATCAAIDWRLGLRPDTPT